MLRHTCRAFYSLWFHFDAQVPSLFLSFAYWITTKKSFNNLMSFSFLSFNSTFCAALEFDFEGKNKSFGGMKNWNAWHFCVEIALVLSYRTWGVWSWWKWVDWPIKLWDLGIMTKETD